MRTKTLLLTAALCAAGIATSMAQAVYSVNAVGYVNTSLGAGYNLISNPLDNKATGGNQVKNLFASLPAGSQVFVFDGTKYALASVDDFTGEITGEAATKEVTPGNGVFVFVPAATTVTFVGEVPAGNLSNIVPKGFSIKASQVPQAGKVQTDLGFPADEGDQVFVFNTATGKYTTYGFSFGAWDNGSGQAVEPTLDVGQAAFFRVDTQHDWKRSFDISK
jgi:hypothetical protein